MLCRGRSGNDEEFPRGPEFVRSSTVIPEVIAIVDRDYAGDFESWIGTLRCLSDLPDDPAICVQVRVKSRSPEELKESAQQARRAFEHRSVTLSWNGDPHIAASCGFDACHQPQSQISRVADISSSLVHSASVHDEVSLMRAQSCNVDYVIFGPVFEPAWKTVHAQGPDELSRIVSQTNVPVVAIGGISLDTVESIAQTGACGIACLSCVMDALDPVSMVNKLQSTWRASVRAINE